MRSYGSWFTASWPAAAKSLGWFALVWLACWAVLVAVSIGLAISGVGAGALTRGSTGSLVIGGTVYVAVIAVTALTLSAYLLAAGVALVARAAWQLDWTVAQALARARQRLWRCLWVVVAGPLLLIVVAALFAAPVWVLFYPFGTSAARSLPGFAFGLVVAWAAFAVVVLVVLSTRLWVAFAAAVVAEGPPIRWAFRLAEGYDLRLAVRWITVLAVSALVTGALQVAAAGADTRRAGVVYLSWASGPALALSFATLFAQVLLTLWGVSSALHCFDADTWKRGGHRDRDGGGPRRTLLPRGGH